MLLPDVVAGVSDVPIQLTHPVHVVVLPRGMSHRPRGMHGNGTVPGDGMLGAGVLWTRMLRTRLPE